MSPLSLDVALVTAAVAAAVSAGCALVFSSFVMRALGQLPGAQAIRAMQAINERAINPLFLAFFIGTGVATLAVSAIHLAVGTPSPSDPWLLAGTAVYNVGLVLVTIARSVPLNDALARVDDVDTDAAGTWNAYDRPWTGWNHLRAVAGVVASALFALGAVAG